MAEKTKIGWMNPRKAGQPISQGGEVEGGTLNSLVGCYPVSPGCANCYAVGECWMKQARSDDLGKEFAGTTRQLANGLIQFTGKITFRKEKLYAILKDQRPRSWFVNSLSDLFYESEKGSLDEAIILEHFDVFTKACWQEFRALTKRAERMLRMDSKIKWPANVRMGVSVESTDYLYRIALLGKTHAQHKWISFEPWITPWPETKNIRKAFPLTIDGNKYARLRDLLKASNIECSIVGGESDETKNKPRYCGFDDIHYILDETTAAGAHACLKQLGTRWAVSTNNYGAGGQGAHHGSQKQLWPQEFQKYETGWPNLVLPKEKKNTSKTLLYTHTGLLLARDYDCIVLGNRGPYVEVKESQMELSNIHLITDVPHRYYHEYRSNDKANVKVYLQRLTIGYADYKVGFYYIDPSDLQDKSGAKIL